jgi:hypothetical protein
LAFTISGSEIVSSDASTPGISRTSPPSSPNSLSSSPSSPRAPKRSWAGPFFIA